MTVWFAKKWHSLYNIQYAIVKLLDIYHSCLCTMSTHFMLTHTRTQKWHKKRHQHKHIEPKCFKIGIIEKYVYNRKYKLTLISARGIYQPIKIYFHFVKIDCKAIEGEPNSTMGYFFSHCAMSTIFFLLECAACVWFCLISIYMSIAFQIVFTMGANRIRTHTHTNKR